MVDEEGSFGAPLPGAPNVGFRVPAKPLRFKLWGEHKDLSLSSSLAHDLKAKLDKPKGTRDTRVYTGSGHRCGVIPYSSVVWRIAL